MINWNIHYIGLMMIFIISKSVANANSNVKININPKSIKSGDDLIVECLIYDTKSSDRLNTYLSCPFVEKTVEYCYADCIDICKYINCQKNENLFDKFTCNRNESSNPKVFSYKISAISNDLINNRKILPFSCKYKGFEVRANVTVIESIPPSKKPMIDPSIISTDHSKENRPSSTKDNILLRKVFQDLEVRNIVLIVLISSLITSFLINIWCCVQCCVRSAKTKKRKRKEKLKISTQSIHNSKASNERLLHDLNTPQVVEENGYPAPFYTDDYIRRAESQPVLARNGKATPNKLSTSNLQKVQAGSMNNSSKYRTSIYNGSINDIYNNGPIPVFDHYKNIIGYTYPSMVPMNNYVYQPQLIDRMNTSQSEDLNTLNEQNSPERRLSSTNQPLPTKPEECCSNLDSASSSHIV